EVGEAALDGRDAPERRAGLGVERVNGAVRITAAEDHQWHAVRVDAVRIWAPRSRELRVRVALPFDLAGRIVDRHHRSLDGADVLDADEQCAHATRWGAHDRAGEIDPGAERELTLHGAGVGGYLDHPAADGGSDPHVVTGHRRGCVDRHTEGVGP